MKSQDASEHPAFWSHPTEHRFSRWDACITQGSSRSQYREIGISRKYPLPSRAENSIWPDELSLQNTYFPVNVEGIQGIYLGCQGIEDKRLKPRTEGAHPAVCRTTFAIHTKATEAYWAASHPLRWGTPRFYQSWGSTGPLLLVLTQRDNEYDGFVLRLLIFALYLQHIAVFMTLTWWVQSQSHSFKHNLKKSFYLMAFKWKLLRNKYF